MDDSGLKVRCSEIPQGGFPYNARQPALNKSSSSKGVVVNHSKHIPSMKMKNLICSVAAALACLVSPHASYAAEVNVTPSNLLTSGWLIQTSGTSTVAFVAGPGTPPCGTGSAEFKVDASGETAAQLRNTTYGGMLLSDITELSYSTYVQFNNSEQAPYIILNIDLDGNGTTDDLLFFEPVYQDATFFPTNDQGDVLVGQWQTWDALNGGWWSTGGIAGAGPGADVKSLADYIAAQPNARIATISAGGVRLVTGFGGPSDWGSFIGNGD
jgi:hypothetical protein